MIKDCTNCPALGIDDDLAEIVCALALAQALILKRVQADYLHLVQSWLIAQCHKLGCHLQSYLAFLTPHQHTIVHPHPHRHPIARPQRHLRNPPNGAVDRVRQNEEAARRGLQIN